MGLGPGFGQRGFPEQKLERRLNPQPEQVPKHLKTSQTKRLNHGLSCCMISRPYATLASERLRTGNALETALGDARAPLSRKLLAVPFVGKDNTSARAVGMTQHDSYLIWLLQRLPSCVPLASMHAMILNDFPEAGTGSLRTE